VTAAALLAAGCSSSGGGNAAKPSSPNAATSAPTSHSSATLSVPSQIGPLKKSADQTVAKELLQGMQGATGSKKLHAVSYSDSADASRTVLVYGGVGVPIPPGDPGNQLKSMLRSGTLAGAKMGKATMVDAGAVGGSAECAPLSGAGAGGHHYVNCGWIDDRSALVMTFTGYEPQNAQALVPQILAAMLGA
jgi:hypothetical protein